MGLIGLIGPGDEPAQRGGNPALFHNLGRVVLVAVKDNPLAPSGQFQAIGQQLGIVKLIDVRVHLQRLLIDGLGAEEHPLQARGGVHRHLDDPHALFGGFPHRLRVLGLDHKGGVVTRPCQRGALLMEDAGIIWRMGAGDMTNLHPFFSLLSFDCFFSEGGCLPLLGNFARPVAPASTFWALRPKPRVTFLRKESHQRFARNLLVPGPPAQGGDPPWIPPTSALVVLVAVNKTLKYPREQYTCRATD